MYVNVLVSAQLLFIRLSNSLVELLRQLKPGTDVVMFNCFHILFLEL
jgi:hypothetical protein